MRAAWWGFWRYLLPRHLTFVALSSMCGAVLLACGAVIAGGTQSAYRGLDQDSALTLVELSSSAPGGTKEVTSRALTELARRPDVVSVTPWAQIGLMSTDALTPDGTEPIIVWATTQVRHLTPTLTNGVPMPTLRNTDLVAPHHVGSVDFEKLVGKTITLLVQTRQGGSQVANSPVAFHLVGTYEPGDVGLDGPGAAYVAPDMSMRLAALAAGESTQQFAGERLEKAFIQAKDSASALEIAKALTAEGYTAGSLAGSVAQLPAVLQVLRMATWVVGAFLLLNALSLGGAIGAGYAVERQRYVGILRSLGWTSSRVFWSAVGELTLLGALCGVLCLLLSVVITIVLAAVKPQVSGLTLTPTSMLPWEWALAGLVGPVVALWAGGFGKLRRAMAISPDEALREL